MSAHGKIAAGLVALAVCVGQVKAQTPATPKPAAVVNGIAIPLSDVDAILKAQGLPVETPEAKRRELQFYVLSNLIDDLLLQEFLKRNGKRLDSAEISKQVAELEAGLKKQGKTLQDFCKETGQSEARLRTNAACYLQWTAYVEAHITDADVRRFYEETRDFFDGATIRVSHIMLKVSSTATDPERTEARAKLLAIRAHIQAGKLDFAEAAKKYSQTDSASRGGDLGFLQRKGDVEEPFAKAAFALREGEVSGVVQTDLGIHLLKVAERKAGKPSDFEKIKDRVRECYTFEMREAVLAEQRKTAKIEINLP
jgi:parvulin-like peptidyl-prolyl isomerase